MTGIERTLASFRFQPIDRPPVAGGLWNNWRALADIAGADDFWGEPRKHVFEAFRRLGCDAILGPVMPKAPEAETDGVDGRATGFTHREVESSITTPEGVAELAKQAPSPQEIRAEFDFQAAYDGYLNLMQSGQRDAGDMLYIPHCLGHAPHFPTSDGEYTYEAFLMACALHVNEMTHLFQAWGERSRCHLEAFAQATVERGLLRVIWIGQDICSRRGPMLSPALLERLYFPIVRHAIEPLLAAGMKVVWHADANYREILPQMIELGLAGFQGFYEEEGGILFEDLAQTDSAEGNPLILFGGMSTVTTLPQETPDDVRKRVDHCFETVRDRGGLLLAPSSSIGPEAPVENVIAMYEHANSRPS